MGLVHSLHTRQRVLDLLKGGGLTQVYPWFHAVVPLVVVLGGERCEQNGRVETAAIIKRRWKKKMEKKWETVNGTD